MFSNQDLKKLIVPLFQEQLLVALVGIEDVFVIGFVGEAAVSGVSLVNAFNMIFINLFTTIGVRLIFSVIFAIWMNMGVMGIALAMCLDWSVRGIIFWWRFKQGKWKTFKVIRE